MKSFIIRNYDEQRLRRGIAKFVAEYTNQSYEEATEYNCEMIDWIQSYIESEFEADYTN